MTPTAKIVRAVIVDDSAFARKVMREILSACPDIEVIGVARDGEEALGLVASLDPDIVICDLVMPRLDGVGFLRKQMATRPLPIMIVSSAPQDGELVIEAFHAGAVDLVSKPNALATEDLRGIRDELIEKVLSAASVSASRLAVPDAPAGQAVAAPPPQTSVRIVLIGISTGGPQALRHLLPKFPRDFPVPIAVVLHLPIGYTAPFAEKLNQLCALKVKEAAHGEEIVAGTVYLAQAGRHLSIQLNPQGRLAVELTVHPLEHLHRPAVDVLFRSAAETLGSRVLGCVMTGMGNDGTEGAAWIKTKGGIIITESEGSCVIYGMPRSVVEAGLSDASASLDKMAEAICARL